MNEASVLSNDLASALEQISSAGECRRSRSNLLSLLSEDASLYRGKGTVEVERLRAFIAVRLERIGLADALIPYAIEELETGTSAYAAAAATRILRAASKLPDSIEELIGGAIGRLRSVDEFVQFDTYPGSPGVASISAIEEMKEMLSTLRPKGQTDFGRIDAPASEHHSCCAHDDGIASDPNPIVGSIVGLREVKLQNQDGKAATFGEIFLGRPSLITFFYTRCMNPDKCSRTVSQLGEIQRLICDRGVGSSAMIAGISYDPQYDLPQRLRRYGEDRGLAFGENCQLLRTTGPFEILRDSLQLGVGYGSATVNRHRIELLLTDAAGAIVYSNVRRLWDAQEVTDLLVAIQG